MSIEIRDPLALLPHQAGLVVAPLQEQAAEGQVDLAVKQKAIVIGEPVPIIFCLRASGNGGVLVSPGATEGRFENAAVTNTLTVNLELVLTEGNLVDALTPSQLYQGNCRQGTWLRSYNRRAGSFTAGNFITAVAGTSYWNCPVECGTSGNYEDLTTLAFSNTYLDGDDTWSNQIHAFINSGISVPRILVGTNGASSNIVDLALYLIRKSSRYEESLLDLTAMTEAATFTNYNSFFYQGVYHKSSNLEDWLEDISISFLLRVTEKNGKKGLRPRLPFNANGSINTSAITWVYGFTEEDVLPDGFEIEYIPLTDRQSICVQVLWRQQPQNYAGLMRTLEVRMTGEASTGPFEQYDLSDFCTNETHAVKVGVYHAARRKYITHSLRLHVRPGSYNSTITQGDVVRVRLQRETSEDQISLHDYLYEVERIDRRFDGSVVLDLMHLPIDSQGRSMVAVAVNSATAPGYSYSTGPYELACSVNAGNTTPITDSGANLTLPANSNFEYNITAFDEAQPQGEIDNPADPFADGTSTAATEAVLAQIGGVPVMNFDNDTFTGDQFYFGTDVTFYEDGGKFNEDSFGYQISSYDAYLDWEIVPAYIPTAGVGDFTLETWFKSTEAVAYVLKHEIFGFYSVNASTPFTPYISIWAEASFYFVDDVPIGNYLIKGVLDFGENPTRQENIEVVDGMAPDQWIHVAITRSSGTIKLWLDGVLGWTSDPANEIDFDYISTGPYFYHQGDELRISSLRYTAGTAVYTSNFSPPISPFV